MSASSSTVRKRSSECLQDGVSVSSASVVESRLRSGKIYRDFGSEYGKRKRVPPACPNKPSSPNPVSKAEYERQVPKRDSQETLEDDVSSHHSDNIFLNVAGDVNKKRRVYGLGPESAKHKPSTSATSSNYISRSEFEQMKAAIISLKAENKIMHERLQTLEEEVRFIQEQLFLVHGEFFPKSCVSSASKSKTTSASTCTLG